MEKPLQAVIKTRDLYLIAYDIADPGRLARTTRYMKGWKAAGQKSFCECWLTLAELRNLMGELQHLINLQEDRIHVLQLDPRMRPRLFGRATHSEQAVFTIF